MKTAIFEYGKQSLAEWIEEHRDCERMVFVGEVYFNYWDSNFEYEIKGQKGCYDYRRKTNIGWHSYDLLCGFDSIAKNFHPVEYDITDLHLLDYEGNIDDDDIPCDADEQKPSSVFHMLLNRKYGTRFVRNGNYLTTPDRKVLVHCYAIKKTIRIPEGTETIGRLAFAAIKKPEFKVMLPDGVVNIEDWAFSGSDGLVQINFPDSLTKLGEFAFESTSVTEVLLPDKIEEIPFCCFWFTYIEKLKLPRHLRIIRNCAFLGLLCDSVDLPESVEVVESCSLVGCYKAISVPRKIKELQPDYYYDKQVDEMPERHKPLIGYY